MPPRRPERYRGPVPELTDPGGPDLGSVGAVAAALDAQDYLADDGVAAAVFLALRLHRPLLLEGDAGVGKTEVAKALAALCSTRLIRLQCYEGIDASQALYEWDYARQLVHLRTAEATGELVGQTSDRVESELYSERFLVRRPLLEAIDNREGPPPVLLIDEVDRADDEFEAFLLEVLSDYSVTVPELGTYRARVPPMVILTSNRTRDLHDALKRRCLYHWVAHPDFEREVAIIVRRVPMATPEVARTVAALTERFRDLGLYKPPGVAEAIDWASALSILGGGAVDAEALSATLGTVIKYREDRDRVVAAGLGDLLAEARPRGLG